MTRTRLITAAVAAALCLPAGGPLRGQNIESPVQVIEGVEPVELRYGQHTVDAAIDTIGDIDRYEFFGEAGDVVRFSITVSGTQEMVILVRGPDGAVVLDQQYYVDGGDFRAEDIRLQARGAYQVMMKEVPSDETGAYILGIERFPPLRSGPDLHRLYYGAARYEDSISPECDVDFFVFEGTAGTDVELHLRVLDSWEGHMEIWSEAGVWLKTERLYVDGGDFTTVFSVPDSGQYHVAVLEYNPDESGRYDLSLQCLSGPCPPIDQAVYQIVDAGPNCISLRLINNVPVVAGELSLGYDSRLVTISPAGVTSGLPAAFDLDVVTGISLAGCPADLEIDRGLTINWLDRQGGGDVLLPGRREILTICFDPTAAATNDTCPRFKFLGCLGPAGFPVQNLVTDLLGNTIVPETVDGSRCTDVGTPFRRGDANGDRRFDLSDAVTILICQFLGRGCTRCPAASDADDSGTMDINDAVYLINWRFHQGSQPPAPFPGCGNDPTGPSAVLCIEPACI